MKQAPEEDTIFLSTRQSIFPSEILSQNDTGLRLLLFVFLFIINIVRQTLANLMYQNNQKKVYVTLFL